MDAIEIARGKLHIPKKKEQEERKNEEEREREKKEGISGSFRGRRERCPTLIAGNR